METNKVVAESINTVSNNNNINNMKKLNLLFIEGNRQNIDKENVRQSYNKIASLGYIPTMPIEYIPMEETINKIGDRKLFKVTVVRKTGEGVPVISIFDLRIETVNSEDYRKYDGVCGDGQHRSLALQFPDLNGVEPTYTEIHIPENMNILSYIALRNNGKNWSNDDFYYSGITTNEGEIDYILKQCNEKHKPPFTFPLYTLGTANLQPKQLKAIQLGYKRASDYKKLQLNTSTREMGDKLLDALTNHKFLTNDRLTGRLAGGIKLFYEENGKNIQTVLDAITLIDKETWDKHFTTTNGQSMEIKSFAEALKALYAEFNK